MLNYRKIEAGDDAQLAEIIRAIYLTDSAKGKGYGKELGPAGGKLGESGGLL